MHHIPVHDLWWLAAGGAGARYVRYKVRHYRNTLRRSRLPDSSETLLDLQARYGYNAHSMVSITPGAATFSMPGVAGAIIYGEFDRVWLAAGDPIADPRDIPTLVHGFLSAASRVNRIAAFVPATERFARQARSLGLSAVKIGAAPYFDLSVWNPKGNQAKSLRAGVNQASRAGVVVSLVDHMDQKLKEEATELCFDWLKNRRSATTFRWLLALDPFLHFERKRLFIARDGDGRLVGLLAVSPMPARDGWYLEDVLRRFDAPPGTTDLLVVHALKCLKLEGAKVATLGTAPLAKDGVDEISSADNRVIERGLRTLARRFSAFYNFEGLRRFKGKFVPTYWESEYLVVQKGTLVPPRVANALLRALVPGGLKEILARKALRSLHGQLR